MLIFKPYFGPGDNGGYEQGGSNGGSGSGTIGAIVTGAGMIYNAAVDRKNTKDTIKANKELAQYGYSQDLAQWNRQNAYNLDMWNMQNQYNSPQAQMSRLKAAGLNPNMAAGSGSAGGSASPVQQASSPKYNAPTVQYNYKPLVDIPGMLSMYQDFQMRQAQINNVKAQTNAVNQRTVNDSVRENLLQTQYGDKWNEYQTKMQNDTYQHQADIVTQQARQGEIKSVADLKGLALMSQEQQLNVLRQLQAEKNLSATDLENEKRRADIMYKNMENQWRSMGITSSDHVLVRIYARLLGSLFKD